MIPHLPASPLDDHGYTLADRYRRTEGRVFLTGTQALLRLMLDQRRRDVDLGLNTAGFVSGYRGSPLGAVDREFIAQSKLVANHDITFLPAINEDLAATAMMGSQQVETDPDRTVEGVFGMWYGKGPGVDRAGDALKHGNAYGSSPNGGVLVVAGDDHGCVSSSMPHQSDAAFLTFFMPILSPSNVGEILSMGIYGYALSRYSGMWVGFKVVSEMIESGMSVELAAPRRFVTPDFQPPAAGLHYRWPDLPGPHIEERMEAKKKAALAFAYANPIDHAVFDNPDATYGIVTTGKGHLDLMEALRLLGIDRDRAKAIGLDVYKVGMVWPLEHRAARAFAAGKRELLVVEEKRGIIESQLKEYFYDDPGQKPERMVGKRDEHGDRLIPWTGELGAKQLAAILARRLDTMFPDLGLQEGAEHINEPPRIIDVSGVVRTPYFCSGCPHSTSTKVPDGSKAMAGIGCHVMATWMDRETSSLIQMGGEGVNWVARSLFNDGKHIFQNLGEGTYYHSGSMAIRQAVAAGTNITYKILFNDAVAMTGGQQVDGPISVKAIAQEMAAEGVGRIAVVSDQPEMFVGGGIPRNVTLHHRDDLDAVQRELRDIEGVTVLIYQQTCATEKRRLRKRGKLQDPKRFAVINDLVCEGCGDCSIESNCLSVEPKETRFGRKRQINLSSCNKDFTCLNGFCPSFVTVEGATRKKTVIASADEVFAEQVAALPLPIGPAHDATFNLLVTGVGGTGVVTVGQVIAMAAHLEGKAISVLDFTGFAQKFGPVLSYVRLAASQKDLNQVRIEPGSADAVIGCDLVVSSSPKASVVYHRGKTRIMLNSTEIPTGDFTRNRDADLKSALRTKQIADIVGADHLWTLNANKAAEALLGDAVLANMMLLGAAWQKGLIPICLEAMERAITLNGIEIEKNREAFTWGRISAHVPAVLQRLIAERSDDEQGLDAVVAHRVAFLTDYQDRAWADRYTTKIEAVKARETNLGGDGSLAHAVARSLFKLMSYKDEYEVARLHTETGFIEGLDSQFEGDFKVVYHLAPPLLSGKRDARGRPKKRAFGAWIRWPMRMLARMKRLRGSPFDPFGYTAERRMERALITEFETTIDRLLKNVTQKNLAEATRIAAMVMEIRGFGPVKDNAVQKVRAEMDAALLAFERDVLSLSVESAA